MKRVIKYAVTVLCGIAICLAVIFGKGAFSVTEMSETIKIIADAFTVSGLVLLLSGLFVWIVRQGTFNGLGYAFKSLFVALHDKEYRESHKETYVEYSERKDKKSTPFLFLIITGGAFLIPAIVFTILFFYI